MKVTYNWLKDFVDITIAPQLLAEKLTMAGLEVVSTEAQEEDFVFEIEITSNRPDWLSVIGIAREIAAITSKKLKIPALPRPHTLRSQAKQALVMRVENKKDCPLYTARIIRNVKVAPSPGWLRQRLELVGCRSVNNIVDITNYALFEWGEPLHAFDFDALQENSIIIRRARDKERIITIDGQERILSPEILVIADGKKPVAVAGVMGGEATEVRSSSKNILLEAAIFNPGLTRRSRQRLGMQSEASYRFERGVTADVVEKASLRATQLIQEIACGEYVLEKYSGAPWRSRKSIILDPLQARKISGVKIPQSRIKTILSNLGFGLRPVAKKKLLVQVPFWRQDVVSAIDLVEELTRIYGYGRLPTSIPRVSPRVNETTPRDLVSIVKNTLLGLGLNEVITHSLISRQLLADFGINPESSVELKNPLSKEQAVLRPSLLPSLARCVSYNLNQRQAYVNIFEIAKVFSLSPDGSALEELCLGVSLCGEKSFLSGKGLVREEASPLHLKGIAEALFKKLGTGDYHFVSAGPGETGVYLGREEIGRVVNLPKEALEKAEIKNKDVFMLELALDKIFAVKGPVKKFIPLPRYPGIVRDISFICRENISTKELLKAMEEKGSPLLEGVAITDYYKGKQIPQGYRSLTVSCLYRCGERTLTEAEVNPVHEAVFRLLKDKFGVSPRVNS